MVASCASNNSTRIDYIYKDINLEKKEKLISKVSNYREIPISFKMKYSKEIYYISDLIFKLNKENFDEELVKSYFVESNTQGIHINSLNQIIIPSLFINTFNYSNGFNEQDYDYIICHEFSHIIKDEWSRKTKSSHLDKLLRNFNPTLSTNLVTVFSRKNAKENEISAFASANINEYKIYERNLSNKNINTLVGFYFFENTLEIAADITSIKCMKDINKYQKPSITLKKLVEINKKIKITNELDLIVRISEIEKHE